MTEERRRRGKGNKKRRRNRQKEGGWGKGCKERWNKRGIKEREQGREESGT